MSEVYNPLAQSLSSIVNDVQCYLGYINPDDYNAKIDILSQGTIGQHTRHFIEFFQCLYEQVNGTDKVVDYGARKRDIRIEVDPAFALETLKNIMHSICVQQTDWDRVVQLRPDSDMPDSVVSSSYAREIFYGVEHCIHHLAIIKIGIIHMHADFDLPENFGIAPSTVKYRQKTCAQ
jgi:hypothetical protein